MPIPFSRYVALFAVAIALAYAAPQARADSSDGWEAFTAGELAKAETIWRPLAEAGDHNAAFGLGMLEQTRDKLEQAARWYEQAARAGVTAAQVLLGSMYIDGRGVPRDAVRAYAWIDRATRGGHANAARARDAVGATLGAADLVRARELSESLAPAK
jgi:TPR repeat protein